MKLRVERDGGGWVMETKFRHKISALGLHIVVACAILLIGSDFAAMDGRLAKELLLAGSGIIPFIPWIGVGIYFCGVVVSRNATKRWKLYGGIFAGFFLAILCIGYPNWLYERYSQKIEAGSFLSADEIKSFEEKFNTSVIQTSRSGIGATYIVVPRNKYSPAMVAFLKARTEIALQPPR